MRAKNLKYLLLTLSFLSIYACAQKQESSTKSAHSKKELALMPSGKKVEFPGKKQSVDCEYEQNMAKQGLVNIKDVDSDILVELKYSTTDNFVGKDVYGCISICYLQKKVANMLAAASKYLKSENDSLRLLVYDGARPLAIQKILWESLPQYKPSIRKNYVANPAEGSIHNYGSAIDLTISNRNGQPIDMGTKYDFFGELAFPKLEAKLLTEGKLTQKQINNRKLLRSVMRKAGFTPIEYEWWHFNAVSRQKAKSLYKIVQ
ncbi:MAG: M15 family metallopeptidase [Bacteroidota bacterium]